MSIGALVNLAQPWWLMATAAGVVPAAVAIQARRRGRHLGAVSVALQVTAVALAALALARPGLPLGQDAAMPYMVLRDVSDSARAQADRPLGLARDLPRESYDFAASVVRRGQSVAADQTHLTPALRLALAGAKQLAGVIVSTDGQFADENWRDLAAALGRSGLEVWVVPMESPPADVRIAELAAARRADGAVQLRVTVASNGLASRQLTVWREGTGDTPLLRRTLRMIRESVTIRLSDALPGDAAAVYQAALSVGDAFAENDAAGGLVLPMRQRVAVVSLEGSEWPAGLSEELKLRLDEIRPAGAPASAAGWADYAAVLLIDPDGASLRPEQRAGLAEYVRSGGGLVLVGSGPHRQLADREDPLNRVAPLVPNPYERRPLKVTVVLDASGSMAEPAAETAAARRIKFDLAREGVLALRRHLTASDELSVITFSDIPQRIYDSAGGRVDFAAVSDALARVEPGGPTKVREALELAAGPAPRPGTDGLVLLVSDLETQPFDPEEMAQRFGRARLSLAVVVTRSGGEPPPAARPLEVLARRLDAPLVRTGSLSALAEVFAGFLRNARGEAIRRGEFGIVAEQPAFGLSAADLPKLEAYLLCAPQGGAEVLLRVADDPLLARRSVGLGRSASLAAPIGREDNAAWHESPAAGELVAAAVRWVLRPGPDPRYAGTAERIAGKVHIRLDGRSPDGPLNLQKLTARLQAPAADAEAQEAPLLQTAPGVYEAAVPAGAEPLSLLVTDAAGHAVWRSAMGRTYSREYAGIGANWDNLRRLAELTGGRIVSRKDVPALGRRLTARRYTPIWPYLVAAALGVMLLEWATRAVRQSRS